MFILYIALAAVLTLPIVGVKYYSKKNVLGALLCFALAALAWYLGKLVPVAGGAVFGILLGILAGLIKRPPSFEPGIKDTSKKVLQAAIVLFGFQMDIKDVLRFGAQALILIFCVIVASFLVAKLLGKALKVEPDVSTLIGVGTAICGGSAIAAVSPIIKADERKVATAISTIFLFNVLAVFIFPALGHALGMSDTRFGMWAGSAINDTSSVVAAGFSYSDAAGDVATVVKLTRTLMIIPISLIIALITAKKEGANSGSYSIMKTFPWFVVGFLLACLINSTGLIPAAMTAYWGKMGKFLIVPAMVGIGLNTNVKELLKNGKTAILLGGCCSVAVALTSLLGQAILGIR